MAGYLIAAQRSDIRAATVFEGAFTDVAFADATTIRFGTRYVKGDDGLYPGNAEIGEISNEIPAVVGAAPARVSVNVTLHNHDRALDPFLAGTVGASPGAEYLSPSFLSLRGKFYHLIRDTDGVIYKEAVSPTMVVSGDVEFDGFSIRFNMSSLDDKIIGKTKYMITARQVRESRSTDGVTALADGAWYKSDGTTGTYTQAQFDEHRRRFTENLEELAPHVFGLNAFPLLSVGGDEGGDYFQKWIVCVCRVPPANVSEAFVPSWRIYHDTRDEEQILERSADFKLKLTTYKIERWCPLPDGTLARFWIVWLGTSEIEINKDEISGKQFWLETETPLNVRASTGGAVQPATPAYIVTAIVGQLSETGSSAIDSTSLARCYRAMPHARQFGGRVQSDTSIAEIIEAIGRAAGLCYWIDNNDTLYMLPNQAFDASDAAALAAGTLPHLRAVDIFGGWREEIPRGANRRGAACHRITIDWPSEIMEFWGERINVKRIRTASIVPLGMLVEGDAPGGWIYPPRAAEAFASLAARRATVARRVSFVSHPWLATYTLGSLFIVSDPRGIGVDTSGEGYLQRLMRLEKRSFMPRENACKVTFEDLGRVADLKPAVLDTITNWISRAPSGSIELRRAGTATSVYSSTGVFVAGDVGRHLWTPGAVNEANRLSLKITGRTSANLITVEAGGYPTNETIAASGSGWDAAWVIMESQGSKGSAYRPDKIRLCKESNGKFRDGVTPGYNLTGG